MPRKSHYQTKQKSLVLACMEEHANAYLSVDEACAALHAAGENVGRTTVYRILEASVADGSMAKVAGARGDAARYRSRGSAAASQGQLSCLICGRAYPLDCSMLQNFADHVESHHGFVIDQARTVLYGLCDSCRATGEATHA